MSAAEPEPPQLNQAGVVVVCAWCWPCADRLLSAFPALRALPLSHGICEAHRALLIARVPDVRPRRS